MEDISHHAVNCYLSFKGLMFKGDLRGYGDHIKGGFPFVHYSIVKKWAAEFKLCRERLEEDPIWDGQSPSPHRR